MLREVPPSLVNNFLSVARNAGMRFAQLFETLSTEYTPRPVIQHICDIIIGICNNASVNGVLQTLRDAYISRWIDNAYRANNLLADEIQDDLTRDLDQVIDSLYCSLKDVEQQLRTIGFAQQCELRADLISDLFTVVVRDVAGRVFEICGRWFKKANDILVLKAVRARIEGATALPQDVLNKLRFLLRPAPRPEDVLDLFVTVYQQVSTIYHLPPERILDYLIEKQVRNNNSHCNNSFNEYAHGNLLGNNPIPETYFTQFVDTYGPGREVFYNNELNQLHAVLGQLCLQRSQPSYTRFYPNEIVRARVTGYSQSEGQLPLVKVIREVTPGWYLVRWGVNLQNEDFLSANPHIQRLDL